MGKHFELALTAAEALVRFKPWEPDGWSHRSFALHGMKRAAEAQENLRPAAEKFSNEWLIWYNLACYACLKIDAAACRLRPILYYRRAGLGEFADAPLMT